MNQLSFDIGKEKKPDPERIKTDIIILKTYLARRKVWCHARQIKNAFDFSHRYTRKLAKESGGEIISGNEGYRSVLHATPDEVRHFIAKMRKMGSEIINRGLDVSKFYHSYGNN